MATRFPLQQVQYRPVCRNVFWGRVPIRMEAPKAPTGWGLGSARGYPLPSGVGPGEGAVPPPQKNFGMFSFEMVHFDVF